MGPTFFHGVCTLFLYLFIEWQQRWRGGGQGLCRHALASKMALATLTADIALGQPA